MEFFNIEMDTNLSSASFSERLCNFFGVEYNPSPKGSAAVRAMQKTQADLNRKTAAKMAAWGK